MSDKTTFEIDKVLSSKSYDQLVQHATARNTDVHALVKEAIEDYLERLDNEDDEDTPDEKIEADLRQGLRDAMAGRTVPAREAIAAIRKAMSDDTPS
jgi:predicted transcriptional regulator